MNEEELVLKIKQKKELNGVDNSIILKILRGYLRKNKISLKNKSEKELRLIMKEVRAELRLLTGRFQKSKKDRESLLKKNKIEELLKTHSSTYERLDFYPKLREIIKKEDVRSILDLGCGLNPLALANKKTKYYASDINEENLEIVQKFFDKHGFPGETFVLDIREIKKLPKTDLCLIFKTLDIIDPRHNLSKNILEKINSPRLIVSFSTKKLSGKRMNFPKRIWFEKLIESLPRIYETIETENEIFYLISC